MTMNLKMYNILQYTKKLLALSVRYTQLRADSFIHQVTSCAVIIIISMTFSVKFLPVSLLMVFFLSTDNYKSTTLLCLLSLFSTLLITPISIFILKYYFSYPLIRTVLGFSIVFIGMFICRLHPLFGKLGYVMAINVIYTLSFYDTIHNPETILRSILWSFVATCYATIVVILVNNFVKPSKPTNNIRYYILNYIQILIKQLTDKEPNRDELKDFEIERDIGALNSSMQFSSEKKSIPYLLVKLGVIQDIMMTIANINLLNAKPMDSEQDNINKLVKVLEKLQTAIEQNHSFDFTSDIHFKFDNSESFEGQLQRIVDDLKFFIKAEKIEKPLPNVKLKSAIIPSDIFKNPIYSRFAFKATISSFIAYLIYEAAAWDGVFTCVLTCLIIAEPSQHDSNYKSVSRFFGCCIGSILTLLASVFILPHFENITGFLFVSLSVIGIGVWVSTGSERIKYVGIQISLAYVLSVCNSFALYTDLIRISNRLVGIFLGLLIGSFIQNMFWSEDKIIKTNLTDNSIDEMIKEFLKIKKNDDITSYTQKWNKILAEIRNYQSTTISSVAQRSKAKLIKATNPLTNHITEL